MLGRELTSPTPNCHFCHVYICPSIVWSLKQSEITLLEYCSVVTPYVIFTLEEKEKMFLQGEGCSVFQGSVWGYYWQGQRRAGVSLVLSLPLLRKPLWVQLPGTDSNPWRKQKPEQLQLWATSCNSWGSQDWTVEPKQKVFFWPGQWLQLSPPRAAYYVEWISKPCSGSWLTRWTWRGTFVLPK